MKPILVATICVLSLCFALLRPASATLWFGPDQTFHDKFKKLMGDKPQKAEQEKLVKAESSNAAAWIARFSEILAERPDDPDAGPFLTDLAAAWKAAMKSEFPEREKRFFLQLDAKTKHDRVDLRKRYDAALSTFEGNADKRDAWVYTQLVDELEQVAGGFEQIGDSYYASESWLLFSACADEPLRGTTADLKRALKGLEEGLTQRTVVDLSDAKKEAAEKRKVALETKGSTPGAPAGKPASSDPTDAGPTVNVPLTFDMLKTIEDFQRPCYIADENYLTWHENDLKGKGSSIGFENTPGAPNLYRVASAEVRLDTDGDGKGDGPKDDKLPLSGNITPVKVMLGRGDGARPWAFFVTSAGDKESYQELYLNMQPSDDLYRIFVASAASVTGTLDGQAIRIIDDSMDGVFGSEPQSYGFPGMIKGEFQPDMDSIVVGTGKRARPWSEFQQVGDKWFKFEMLSDGKEIKASPVKVDTGVIKLEFKGPLQPSFVVVKGSESLKNSYFDLVEGGTKGIEVPVGRYTLCYGEIRTGKKKQVKKCVIVPSAHNAVTYDVTKDKPITVTLGAPYSMDFDYKYDDGKLTVNGRSVVISGSAGEHYERMWHCILHPEVSWRKKGTKNVLKSAKMPPAVGGDFEKLGFDAAWFPLDLPAVDLKGVGDIQVQLSEKKNELFGKVESEWK